eukprot:COSAG02_NODE_8175_length_2675_cov_10.726027_2_plen_89_part_00
MNFSISDARCESVCQGAVVPLPPTHGRHRDGQQVNGHATPTVRAAFGEGQMAEGVPQAETDAAKKFLSEVLAERRWETAEVSSLQSSV